MSDASKPEPASSGEPYREEDEQTKLPVMLALLDVLGFSRRIEDDGIDAVLPLYNALIASTVRKEAEWSPQLVDDGSGSGSRFPALIPIDVRFAYFSDTILFWMPLFKLFVSPFLSHCTTFFCEALAMRVPVRGAIALGEAVLHRPTGTFLGQPLVDAALLEKEQAWLGVALAHSATWPEFMAQVDPRLIIEYDAPAKKVEKSVLSPVVLDWPRRWRELHGTSPRVVLDEMERKAPHVYCRNTLPFIEHSFSHTDWYERSGPEMENARLRMKRGTV